MLKIARASASPLELPLTLLLLLALLLSIFPADAAGRKGKKRKDSRKAEDPYAEYVWPPPPDPPRIKLQEVLTGRIDVEPKSRFQKILLGASPQSPYDDLVKPFGVAFDPDGRILVSDPGLAAVLRFDRSGRRLDVLGVRGPLRLKLPLGLTVADDGRIFVADGKLLKVVAMDAEGKLLNTYGSAGELVNPTDAELSPDGTRLFVADSKAHKVVVFDTATAKPLASFGRRGEGEGEFSFPTSLAFDGEGNLLVVDQLNSRVQLLSPDGEYLDELGGLGVGFGNFVRPKDVAVDGRGLIYVTDNAFNNLQLFDADLTLLTFVGEGGRGPGQFHGASGVAVRGEELAVVDQLGRRVQIFRFLTPPDEG